jgi:hypothetical protein
MGTQLILTVGTNPLPVWVAWFHLKDQLDQPIQVRLVHTPGTVNEKKRLETYCAGASFLAPIDTSSGDPGAVRNDVGVILADLNETPELHVHYTGGTKVMSVETVAALEYGLPQGVDLYTSYLDPRGASGPTIVDSHGSPLVPDTRQNVTANLQQIALLNGFTLGSFVHEYWDNQSRQYVSENCPAPAVLNEEQQRLGRKVLSVPTASYGGGINSTHFEYAVYVAFKEALEQIATRNSVRNNYELFHSVHVRRTGANQRDPHFELDVVVVLGYQIVVVSCTLDAQKQKIKTKGMEVILRARQLGGDEARAVVLCSAHPNDARLVERELHDEVGTAGTPLKVWGTDKWGQLPNAFEQYLRNDLHWM